MEKRQYFINIGTKEISQIPFGNNAAFTIEATGEEIFLLREKFDEMSEDEFGTFTRSHVPFLQYHEDPENFEYDQDLKEAYQMIYQLATPETKQAMKESGMSILINETLE